MYPGSPLGAKCNGVKQKGCQGEGLEGLLSGHHEDNDRLFSPQERAWTEQDPPAPMARLTHPAREVHSSGLSSRDGEDLRSHLRLCIQSKYLHLFQALCSLGCRPDFLVYYQLLHC